MPGNTSGNAFAHRDAGKDGAVARPASQHHCRALIERPQVRFGSHHTHNTLSTVDRCRIERRCRLEGFNSAFAQAPLQVRLVLLCMDTGQGEAEPLLGGNLTQNVFDYGNMGLATRRPCRAQQERNAGRPCGQ
jgi:hypothetical protein